MLARSGYIEWLFDLQVGGYLLALTVVCFVCYRPFCRLLRWVAKAALEQKLQEELRRSGVLFKLIDRLELVRQPDLRELAAEVRSLKREVERLQARRTTPFGKLVRRLCQQRGLTLDVLATHLGVRPSHLTDMLTGEFLPTETTVEAIIDALGLSERSTATLRELGKLSLDSKHQSVAHSDRKTRRR